MAKYYIYKACYDTFETIKSKNIMSLLKKASEEVNFPKRIAFNQNHVFFHSITLYYRKLV